MSESTKIVPRNLPVLDESFKSSWKGSEKWLIDATIFQNKMYLQNQGRMYESTNNNNEIDTRIAQAAFGVNVEALNSFKLSQKLWYNRGQRRIVQKVRKKLLKHGKHRNTIFMNHVYVLCFINEKKQLQIPVFYVKTSADASDNSKKYVDLEGRVYNSWKNFLEKNILPPALCCYPKNGTYGQQQSTQIPIFDRNILLELNVSKTAACKFISKAKRYIGKSIAFCTVTLLVVSTGTNLLKKIQIIRPFIQSIMLDSILPSLINHVAFINNPYTLFSSLFSIIDGRLHDVDLLDMKAEIILSISALLAFSQGHLYKRIIEKGIGNLDITNATFENLSSNSKSLLNMLFISRCAVSVISVVMVLKSMSEKTQLSPNDFFNFASSLFTCFGILVSPLGAKEIFEHFKSEYIIIQQPNDIDMPVGHETNIIQEIDKTLIDVEKWACETEFELVSFGASSIGTILTRYMIGEQQKFVEKVEKDFWGFLSGCAGEVTDDGNLTQNAITPTNVFLNNDNVTENNIETKWDKCENIVPKQLNEKRENHSRKMMENRISKRTNANDYLSATAALDEQKKRLVIDENDIAGKAASEYFNEKILGTFKGTRNEYVMNSQIVRVMATVEDIRAFVCELALTETTFEIKNGIPLINGQLNIDGAVLGRFKDGGITDVAERLKQKIESNGKNDYIKSGRKSVREILMQKIKIFDQKINIIKRKTGQNTKMEIKEERKKFMKDLQKILKINNSGQQLLFEIDIEEFEQMIQVETGMNLSTLLEDQIELNISDYERLIKQFNKKSPYKDKLIVAGIQLAKLLQRVTTEGIVACHQIILNEAFSNQKHEAITRFLNDFNGNNGNPEVEDFIKETNEILAEAYSFLIKKIDANEKTSFDDILLNENPKIVSAIAYARALENNKRQLSLKEKINIVEEKIINTSKNEEMSNYVLSQDGLQWVLKDG